MPPDALAQYQQQLLERVARHAREHVPAYAARLEPLFGPQDEFRMAAWGDLPLLTRAEMGGDENPFAARVVPPGAGPVSRHYTMGTTGKPVAVARTQLAQMVSACFVERRNRWHGIDTALPLGMIVYRRAGSADYPDGEAGRGWSFGNPEAPRYALSVGATVAQQIDWLRRRRPAYLQVYASVASEIAAELGRSAREIGIRGFFTYGEAVDAGQRERIGDAFGAPVIDIYSANEVGTIAVQCPAGDTYHVMAEGSFVEVLGDDGKPVEPGGVGRVVVTPIYNTAMPLLRYALGDFAETMEGACACGSTLPRVRRVLGRARHVFRFADGIVRWPNLHVGDLSAAVPLSEFQVVQHTPAELELRFVRIPGFDRPVDLPALRALAQRDLHPSVDIRVTELAEIPRSPGGKFERYVSHVTG